VALLACTHVLLMCSAAGTATILLTISVSVLLRHLATRSLLLVLVLILVALLAGFDVLFVASALIGHLPSPFCFETSDRLAGQNSGSGALVPSRNIT
jgi:hypothetical protein